MKTTFRFYLVLMLVFLYQSSLAQFANVIVFAPNGEKFTLSVGGTIRNSEPEARVEADVPGGPSFKIKVTFNDPSIKEISKMVFNKPNHTFYFKVDKNQKGAYVLESTSSEWSNETGAKKDTPPPPPPPIDQESKTAKETVKNEPAKVSGEKGCTDPMSQPDFLASLISVSAPPYDPPKLSAAKKLATEHCLTTTQVIEVLYVFDYESTRLNFAKFAYDHTFDPTNYSDVSEALNSAKSKKDLEAYINSKK